MGMLTEHLANKKKWSKSKMEWINFFMNIGFYALIIGAFIMVGVFDYQCKMRLPTGEIVDIDLYDPELPNITTYLVKININNDTECWNETVTVTRRVCNWTYEEEPCWGDPFC